MNICYEYLQNIKVSVLVYIDTPRMSYGLYNIAMLRIKRKYTNLETKYHKIIKKRIDNGEKINNLALWC